MSYQLVDQMMEQKNVERGREYLERLDPELHRYILDFVYGEVYAGDTLDPKTRARGLRGFPECVERASDDESGA